jgi:hypothetical protein
MAPEAEDVNLMTPPQIVKDAGRLDRAAAIGRVRQLLCKEEDSHGSL